MIGSKIISAVWNGSISIISDVGIFFKILVKKLDTSIFFSCVSFHFGSYDIFCTIRME